MKRRVFLTGIGALALAGHARGGQVPLRLCRGHQVVEIPTINFASYAWLRWILRDVQAGVAGHPHPALIALLRGLQQDIGHRVIHVHSGLRTLETNRKTPGAADESRHLPDDRWVFRAVDFHVAGVRLETLGQIARGLNARYVHIYDTWIHADVA